MDTQNQDTETQRIIDQYQDYLASQYCPDLADLADRIFEPIYEGEES